MVSEEHHAVIRAITITARSSCTFDAYDISRESGISRGIVEAYLEMFEVGGFLARFEDNSYIFVKKGVTK